MRNKLIAGNWKMNIPKNGVARYIGELNTELERIVKQNGNVNANGAEIVLCVPDICIDNVNFLLGADNEYNAKIGAQNISSEALGAYTGDTSPILARKYGAKYAIIGHSERRQYQHETDEDVNEKLHTALEVGLKPIVCVGENLKQKEGGMEKSVVTTQTRLALQSLSKEDVEKVTIAYEPIWAIGTGKTATAHDANETAKWIRKEIANLYSEDVAEKVIIQYGGSVNAENAEELFKMSDIDGALVGGASLEAKSFAGIIEGALKARQTGKNFKDTRDDEER